MDTILQAYNADISLIIPREKIKNCCFVQTPKQLFLTLMAGERACFKSYNMAAKYYIRATEIFREIYTKGMSEYDYVLLLNNYIVNNIAYDYDVITKGQLMAEDLDSFEIDGPLFKGKGVCAAKSKFFSLMCCLMNIKTVLVTGRLISANSDSRHAWNKVLLSMNNQPAKWYNIDTTNNSIHAKGELRKNDYFLLSDQEIQNTHLFMDYPETSEYKQINYQVIHKYEYPKAC